MALAIRMANFSDIPSADSFSLTLSMPVVTHFLFLSTSVFFFSLVLPKDLEHWEVTKDSVLTVTEVGGSKIEFSILRWLLSILLGPNETFLRLGLSDKMGERYIFFVGAGYMKRICPFIVRFQFPRDVCRYFMRYCRSKKVYIFGVLLYLQMF